MKHIFKSYFLFLLTRKMIYLLLLGLFLTGLFSQSVMLNAQTVKKSEQTKHQTTIRSVLDYITKKSGYAFMYPESIRTNLDKGIEISFENKDVDSILDELCKKEGYTYKKRGKQITLSITPTKQNSSPTSKASRELVGIIKDAITGETIIGAIVQIKNTDYGVLSDIEGRYAINVTTDSELEVRSIGYRSQTLLASNLGILDINLTPDNQELSEIVVVGAGHQRKVSVTGAITSVKGASLRAPSSDLTSNLAGQLAGVVAVAKSGEPGSGSEFYIRGISTFGGRATPLILLDGVEISSSDLNNIPVESIDGFSILKDASATAIYGARGANGVMLVTTKNGIENTRARINISLENSFLQPTNRIEYVDGATWMQVYNDATIARNPNAITKYSDEQIKYTREGINPYVYPNVDWYNLIFKDYTMNQRANINIQGGGSKVTYYMSLQANHDTGLLNVPKTYSFDNNINRWGYTFQNNIAYQVTPTTKVDLRMNAQIANRKSPNSSTSDIFNLVYNSNPVTFPATFPAADGDSHIKFGSATMSSGRLYDNPYAHMLSSYLEQNTNTLNTSLNIDQKLDLITPGLSATALINFKNHATSYYSRSLTPYYYSVVNGSWDESDPNQFSLKQLQQGTDYISQSDITRYNENMFYVDARINYNRVFDEHTVSGMLMYMQREFRSSVLPQRNQGLSGRFTYDYANRYLAEVNFGYNGTERLAKNSRFELFPAISLGWVISNENFWSSLSKSINFLKIRASYGLVGSDETGLLAGASHFLYLNEVKLNGGWIFASGPAGGYSPGNGSPVVNKYAVDNASWGRAKKFDIGLDIRLFETVDITLDYFHDRRDRILMARTMFPQIMGYYYDLPWSNIGKVDNKGIEFSVNWRKKIMEDMTLDLRGNFTYNENKYIYVDEPNYPYKWQTATGKPINKTVGYVAEGLFESQQEIDLWADQSAFGSTIMPGDIKYRDINGDGKITDEDKIMLSPDGSMPRIQYGIGMSLAYKKFDLGMFFNGSALRKIMINGIAPFCANDTNERNLMQFIADDYWSPSNPNPDAKYPRLGILDTQISNNMQPSSYWLRNANFLRFKTFEVGYSFSKCRVYVNGDNLAVWSPFKLWDPELWYNTYPLQRTFNVGLQLNL